jgi:hypothetical protein
MALGEQLMGIRYDQEAFFHTIGEHFERIDDIIDNNIQSKLDPQDHDGLKKLARVHDLESDLAVVFWLLRYQWWEHCCGKPS